jgi:tetratricopeptide (TPR) repeat protein
MAGVYEQNPSDKEAGAFYALSLLASAVPGDSSLANQKKAVAILNRLFEQDPNHPGLAHYIIHSCDNPRMAHDGLAAARRYAAIASSSPHALHMPSHIFSRVGLWQEDAASNRASIEATRRTAATMGQEDHQLHAMDFLIYAELQMGDDDAAQREVEEGIQVARRLNRHPSPDNMGMNNFAIVEFQAIYDLETRRWADAAAIETASGSSASTRGLALWAKTIGAARAGNTAAAETSLADLRKTIEEMRSSPNGYPGSEMDLFVDEAAAWLAFAQHKSDDAIATMSRAADREDEHGTAEVAIPARQMLGDLLLELGRPQDALAAFETSNRSDPNRFNTVYGAVRAARSSGQAQAASRYLDQLLKTCSSASSARVQQIRAEARAAQSAKPAPPGGM